MEWVASGTSPDIRHWEKRPVPRAHAISGFQNVTLLLDEIEPTPDLLTLQMGCTFTGQEGDHFEIATEPPDFTVEEPVNAPGEDLVLPEWFEPNRLCSTTEASAHYFSRLKRQITDSFTNNLIGSSKYLASTLRSDYPHRTLWVCYARAALRPVHLQSTILPGVDGRLQDSHRGQSSINPDYSDV